MVANFQGAQSLAFFEIFQKKIVTDEGFQLAMPTYHHTSYIVADDWLQQHRVLLPHYPIAAFWSGMNLAYMPLFTRLRIMRLTFSLTGVREAKVFPLTRTSRIRLLIVGMLLKVVIEGH